MVSIFNQATQAKKPEDDQPEWFRNAPDAKDEELPEWFTSAPDAGPDPENIEDEEITPMEARLRVGALNKPEDRLATIRKFYPDAQPYGEDNFIFTNPDTGKTHVYNVEGWLPSWNDAASIIPETMEVGGSVTGGLLGGIGGATVGSSVPVVGTTAGGVTGAIAGAGVGGTTAKDLTERAINWWYGDEDTRETDEYLKDKATDAALSAVGEGAGRLIAAGAKPVIRGAKRTLLKTGKIDDAARQAFEEAEELGLKPTLGTVTQSPKTLDLEARLMKDAPQGKLARSVAELDDAMGGKLDEIATSIFRTPGTKDSVGTLLRDAAKSAEKNELARLKSMYDEFDNLTAGANVEGKTLGTMFKELQAEKAALSQSEKLARGPAIDKALKYAKAVNTDVKNGMSIKEARQFRTDINPLAYGKGEDPMLKEYFQRIYKSATDDVLESAKSVSDDAFKKVQDADAAYSAYKTTGTKKILEKAIKENEPTKVFDFYSRQIKDSPQKLSTVRDALTKDGDSSAWDAFVSHHVRQLGQQTTKTGTKFNPSVLVKQLERMPKESKDVLFKGTTYADDLAKLQKIAAKRATAKNVRLEKPNVVTQVLDFAFNMPSLRVAGYLKDKTFDAYRERLLSNPKMVRELLGLPKKELEKGFIARTHILDAAARAGELEAMRSILDQIEKSNEKR